MDIWYKTYGIQILFEFAIFGGPILLSYFGYSETVIQEKMLYI